MKDQMLKELIINSREPEDWVDPLLHVHTRNGDTVEIEFQHPESSRGIITFGFDGGFERALIDLDLDEHKIILRTTDWSRPQPIRKRNLKLRVLENHNLLIRKSEGEGNLIKLAHLEVYLDGDLVITEQNLNLLPEMGVQLRTEGVLITRFIHRGTPLETPEFLHVGGYQMMNLPSLSENLASLFDGLQQAAEKKVQLLITPETSLTGLFPNHKVTCNRPAIAKAEDTLRKFIRKLPDAPYLVAGLPVWKSTEGHLRKETRYNASRVYDPDGEIVSTHPKIHSCEKEFYHGYGLNEFDIYGVPCCMHVCHDGRYPEVWTLPVMFGARLILHPSNGGRAVTGSIESFENSTKGSTRNSNAFFVHVNGGGSSYIAGPKKFDNLIARSSECRRDVSTFPMRGEPRDCLFEAKIRVHDAFGYWPQRSFRTSEKVAASYLNLYRELGGKRMG